MSRCPLILSAQPKFIVYIKLLIIVSTISYEIYHSFYIYINLLYQIRYYSMSHKFNVKPSNLRSSHRFDCRVTIRLHKRLTFCHNKNARVSVLGQLIPSLLRFLHRLCRALFLGRALVT